MNEQRRTIQIVRAALAFFVWMQILPQSVQANQVHIPDPNLRAVVREALNLPADAPVTLAAMQDLTDLGAGERGITDLSGLEFAINLAFLSIPYNPITDLTPIAKLKNLETIYMWATSVSDISPLANLTKLRVLLASYGGEIVDISPLANLTQLEKINLSGNKIVDITPLENLTHLTHLQLTGNFISDITPLANLTRLTNLELVENRIVDVRPLAGLMSLRVLEIQANQIVDHSPLDALSLVHFTYDQSCDVPSLPLQPRLENRDFPSIFAAWHATINQPHLSTIERYAQHDLYFCCPMFNQHFFDTGDGWEIRGDLERATSLRDEFIMLNPNMVFLSGISAVWEGFETFPEDSPYWARDAEGQILSAFGAGLVNLNHPDVKQRIVGKAVAVDKCGLYDGIFFDGWSEYHIGRRNHLPGAEAILSAIRERVRPEFLIMVNTNTLKAPVSAPYINGLFLESGVPLDDVAERGLNELEDTLSWAEDNLRAPQINGLEGFGFFRNEPPDSARNLRWMRALTTMSLTFSDGYVLYNYGDAHFHYWYDFWDANLGRPIGPKSQLYQETNGLYIREFTNGWAVYNHSGEPQIISLPETVQAVASGLLNTEHALPNLDGEMYLRVKPKNPADVNGDGVVNILDLTLIARGLGTDNLEGDVNGDGVVNVLDLVYVANQF